MASRLAILRRDKWTCRMPVCLHPGASGGPDRKIDPKLERGSPWAATVDHVVPRSLGGSDRGENLRAAQALCNQGAAQGLHHGVRSRTVPVRRGPQGGIITDPYDRIRQAERDRRASA
jgi:5-methylcytosine-specific restriction endonuclease McrA